MRFLPNAFKESKVVIKILQNALPSCFMFYLLLVLGVLALSVDDYAKTIFSRKLELPVVRLGIPVVRQLYTLRLVA